MSQSCCNLLYHIVYSTRYREPWLKEPWLKEPVAARIHEYLGGVIRGEGGVPVIINGVEDHVHLLCACDRI
jgi:REP element-mobilizing transposase RayT